MENYTNHGIPTPSALSYVPTATSLAGVLISGGLQRRVGGDVCPHAGRQQASRFRGTALPVTTAVAGGGSDATPMADVRLVKFRSGSQASVLTG